MNIFINKTFLYLVFLQFLRKKYLVKTYGDILRFYTYCQIAFQKEWASLTSHQ